MSLLRLLTNLMHQSLFAVSIDINNLRNVVRSENLEGRVVCNVGEKLGGGEQ